MPRSLHPPLADLCDEHRAKAMPPEPHRLMADVRLESFCTWSDVRRGQPGRSAEYHLYYGADSEPVVHRARAGDQVVIAKEQDGSLMVLGGVRQMRTRLS
jgi:hypothetical protein